MGRSPSGRLSAARWQRVRLAALERDGWRCTRCGLPGRLEVHHVRPVARAPGAAYDLDNLRTLCRSCHIVIHRPPPNPRLLLLRRLMRCG